MLDAYEARLRPQQTLEERMRAYADPALETKCLEIFQEMIKGTKALLEKQLDKPIPSLENQTTSSKRRRKTRNKKIEELVETSITSKTIPAKPNWSNIVIPNSIPNETTKDWVKNLWEKVREANDMRKEKGEAPLEEINLDIGQVDVDVGSRYGSAFVASKEIVASDMKVLPSFLGDYNSDEGVLKAQSLYHPNPNIFNTSSKQTSTSSPK